MRSRHAALLALVVVLTAPATAQQPAAAPPRVDDTLLPYLDTADSVKLADGREFHFVCMGHGSPAVILTAGLGDWAAAWNKVQPEIAKTTRACAWDRPGFGFSDAPAGKQTVATTTADLEAALARSTITSPYILVSHSLGSYESLLFADHERSAVVGMVLVDPSFPGQMAAMEKVAPAADASARDLTDHQVTALRKCAAALRAGTLKPGDPDPDHCFRYPPNYPVALDKALTAKAANPLQYEAIASFFKSVEEDGELVVNPGRNYGAMPLVVLTATAITLPPGISDEAKQQYAAFISVEWNKAHDALAALSTRGINARVPGTGHYIQRIKPQVVIDAVSQVVAEARLASP